jgi:hypothetical protein
VNDSSGGSLNGKKIKGVSKVPVSDLFMLTQFVIPYVNRLTIGGSVRTEKATKTVAGLVARVHTHDVPDDGFCFSYLLR